MTAQTTSLNNRLVFVHGAGVSPRIWNNQLAYFQGSEAITLPGHHGNEAAGQEGMASVAAYTNWLRQYLCKDIHDRPAGQRVLLAGHSLGGAIAQQYALLFPGELAGLILVGTGSKMRVAPAILNGLLHDYPATVAIVAENSFSDQPDPSLKAAMRLEMEQVRPEVTHGDFTACNSFDMSGGLERLGGQPVLVITGQQDKMVPPRFARTLAEKIPNARLKLIEQAGHYVMQDQPGQFNQAVEDFCKLL